MAAKLRPDGTAPPCPRPASAEITPDEFNHYMREARHMRAEAMAGILDGWSAALARLFRRAQRPARRHEPVFAAPVRARTARSRAA